MTRKDSEYEFEKRVYVSKDFERAVKKEYTRMNRLMLKNNDFKFLSKKEQRELRDEVPIATVTAMLLCVLMPYKRK